MNTRVYLSQHVYVRGSIFAARNMIRSPLIHVPDNLYETGNGRFGEEGERGGGNETHLMGFEKHLGAICFSRTAMN